MTSNEILKADVLDIVFDNRNKQYGAYLLRKYYNNRLRIALGGMIGLVLIIVLIISLNPTARKAFTDLVNSTVVTIEALPEIPPDQPKPVEQTRSEVRSKKFVNEIEIVPDNVPTDVPDQDDFDRSMISTQDKDGKDFEGTQQPSQLPDNPSITESVTPEPTPPPAITKAAEFPGGQHAWIAFLNRHLRTPNELEAGQKRSVSVRFAVSTDGSISQFEILQSGGAAFDNEVIRVLKKMPKWKPAVQNGQNISVMFTQPVTFMAIEE